MAGELATWVVEFDGSGVQAVDGILQDMQGKLEGIDQAAAQTSGAMAQNMADAANRIGRSFDSIRAPSFGEVEGPTVSPVTVGVNAPQVPPIPAPVAPPPVQIAAPQVAPIAPIALPQIPPIQAPAVPTIAPIPAPQVGQPQAPAPVQGQFQIAAPTVPPIPAPAMPRIAAPQVPAPVFAGQAKAPTFPAPAVTQVKAPAVTTVKPPDVAAPKAGQAVEAKPLPAADGGAGFDGLSEAIRQAGRELSATQNSAKGVAAALDFAREKAAQFEDLHDALVQIDQDFGRGAATAQTAHRAIDNVIAQINSRLAEQKQLMAENERVAAAFGNAVGQIGDFGGLADKAADIAQTFGADSEAAKKAAEAVAAYERQLGAIGEAYQAGRINGQQAQEAIAHAGKNASKVLAEQQGKAQEMAEAHKSATLKVAAAYGILSGSMLAWIRAGMQGTSEAVRLGYTMEQISREVANVFAPAIHALIDSLQSVLQWFRGLTGQGQETIRHIAGVSLVFLGLAATLPKVVAGIKMVAAAMQGAITANPILAAVAAIAALLTSTEQGRAALGQMFEAVAPAVQAIGKVIGTVFEALAPAIDAVATVIGTIVEAVSPVIEAFSEILGLVGEIAGLIAGALGGVLKTIAEIVKSVLVPAFELLRPILELIATVVKAISAVGSFFARLLGLGGGKDKKKDALNQNAGGFEEFQATWERIQGGAMKSDVAREQRERMIRSLEMIHGNTRPRPQALGTGVAAVGQ